MTQVSLEAFLRRANRKAEKVFAAAGRLNSICLLVETVDGEQKAIIASMVLPPADARAAKNQLSEKLRAQFQEWDVIRYARIFEAWTLPLRTIRSSSELPDDVGTVFVTAAPGAPFQVRGRRGPTGELFVGSRFTMDPVGRLPNGASMDDCPAWVEIVRGAEAEYLIADLVAIERGSIEDHPLRDEAVYIAAVDHRECLMAVRKIVRPNGGKPYLAEMKIERPRQISGPFTDLLPAKRLDA